MDYYKQAVLSSKQVSNCGASQKRTQHFGIKKVLKKTSKNFLKIFEKSLTKKAAYDSV